MFAALNRLTEWAQPLAQPALERVVLLLNHVISREMVAMERLKPHAGALLEVRAEPQLPWLPPLPAMRLRVTPAGLLEACGPDNDDIPTLRVLLDASQPLAFAQALAEGRVPPAQVEGDVRLAAEADWLMANLRWDLMDDLEAALGAGPAQVLTLLAQSVRAALARWLPPGSRGTPDGLDTGHP
jgi:ubiquinone biosynthesis protein UbiJ